MALRDRGFRALKLFPAEAVGGARLLASIAAPLPDIVFCPTGGIDLPKAPSYLALPNVICVGGSWMLPKAALEARRLRARSRRCPREAREAERGGLRPRASGTHVQNPLRLASSRSRAARSAPYALPASLSPRVRCFRCRPTCCSRRCRSPSRRRPGASRSSARSPRCSAACSATRSARCCSTRSANG